MENHKEKFSGMLLHIALFLQKIGFGGGGVCAIVKGKKADISAPGPKTKKSKYTLLSQTLKVEEDKVFHYFPFMRPFDKKTVFWLWPQKVS